MVFTPCVFQIVHPRWSEEGHVRHNHLGLHECTCIHGRNPVSLPQCPLPELLPRVKASGTIKNQEQVMLLRHVLTLTVA